MAENSYIKMNAYSGSEDVTVSSGMVHTEGNRVILRGEDFELIPHQSIVEVVGYRQDGIVIMSGKVTLSTRSQLNMDILKADGKQERRSYLKVRVYMAATLLSAFSMGRRAKPYGIGEAIVIRDISLGGIAFYSSRVLFKKQNVELDFSGLREGFIVRAEILRKERGLFQDGYRFKYGCRLLNISGEEERLLCEFVFRMQLENHKKASYQDEESQKKTED